MSTTSSYPQEYDYLFWNDNTTMFENNSSKQSKIKKQKVLKSFVTIFSSPANFIDHCSLQQRTSSMFTQGINYSQDLLNLNNQDLSILFDTYLVSYILLEEEKKDLFLFQN
jgi:hypothetical protein